MVTVRVENIHKRYGEIVALEGVTLEFEDGTYTCIIGPSGSGKTTLLKIIAGILEPDKGRVYFDGEDVTRVPVRERGLGIISQDVLLFPHMDVWENVVYSLKVKGLDPKTIERSGREVIRLLNLKYNLRLRPESLSRGSQQKVAIARAVAATPKLFLFDEPFGSIDVRAAVSLRSEIKRLAKELKLTTIHITHNQEEALSIADKIVVMRKGRIEQVGTPEEVYYNPKTPFVARFIGGEANFFEAKVRTCEEGRVTVVIEGLGLEVESISMRRFRVGERVLVSVKPEHVSLGERGAEGLIVEENFLGPYIRLVVEAGNREVYVRVRRGRRRYKVGDRVCFRFERVNVFSYPEVGIEKAIAYE